MKRVNLHFAFCLSTSILRVASLRTIFNPASNLLIASALANLILLLNHFPFQIGFNSYFFHLILDAAYKYGEFPMTNIELKSTPQFFFPSFKRHVQITTVGGIPPSARPWPRGPLRASTFGHSCGRLVTLAVVRSLMHTYVTMYA